MLMQPLPNVAGLLLSICILLIGTFYKSLALSSSTHFLPPRFESFAEQFDRRKEDVKAFYAAISGEDQDVHFQWLKGVLTYKSSKQDAWSTADESLSAKYAPLMKSLGVRFGGASDGRVYFGGFSFSENGKFVIVDIQKYLEGAPAASCQQKQFSASEGACDEPLTDGWFVHYVWREH